MSDMIIFVLIIKLWQVAAHIDGYKSSGVLELSEKFLDVKDEGHWFIKFYAPWCGHCKKLQPVWEQVASILSARSPNIRVGRIDCTRFSDVANKLNIHGFPTIRYFRNGHEFTYDSDRSREALVDYALKLEGPEVRPIPNSDIFMRLYVEHYLRGGLFVLVAETTDDSKLKNEFVSIAKEMFSKVSFAHILYEHLPKNISLPSLPAVVTFKDSNYFVYTSGHSGSLRAWIVAERWPIMPLITYGNLYDIGLCCNKLLVMVVSDLIERSNANSPIKRFHALVRETAKFYYSDFHDHFQFGWTDGNEIANSILLKTTMAPFLVVFNVSSYQYYVSEDPADYSTKESLALFLKGIISGEIQAYGGKGIVQRVKRAVYELYTAIYGMFSTQPLLSCCLFGLPLGVLSVICYTLCSTDSAIDRDEIYKDSDEEDDEEYSDGYGERRSASPNRALHVDDPSHHKCD